MSSYRLLFNLAQRHPALILLNILFGFSGALFNGISTVLIIPILLSFLGQPIAIQDAPPIMQFLVAPLQSHTGESDLLLMAGMILGMIILKNLFTYSGTLIAGILKRSISHTLREKGIRLLLEVDIEYYTKTGIGDIINRLNNEISRAGSAIGLITRTVTILMAALVLIGLLLAMSWQLSIVAAGLLILVIWINQYTINRSKALGKQLSETSRHYSIAVLDLLSGMRLVRSTASEQTEFEKIKQYIYTREQVEFKAQATSALIEPLSEVTGLVALLSIVFIGHTCLSEQVETFSQILLTYLFVLFRALPLIAQINGIRSQFANISSSLEIAHDFLRRDNKSFMTNGAIPFHGLQSGIHFQQLSFTYPGQQKPVLNNIDLYLPRNQTLALVGASGAGKSTLADLLPRFYTPTQGKILIDQQDLCDLDYRSLRRSMGIVSQDPFLFNTTARENIAYGCPNATNEQIIAAAKQANAYDFILQLPQGFDTQIGDRGILLSAGQRQRIAIARALIQNPEILILDEATSALDSVSEYLVQEAIENLSRDRTTLVIAHRLSTVKKADQIAVMEQGQIIELGTHEQLMARNGYYARLCEMQLTGPPSKPGIPHNRVAQISYEIRSRLNNLVGSLSLLINDAFDTVQEHQEFTQDAYISAIHLLKSLERLEQDSTEFTPPSLGDLPKPIVSIRPPSEIAQT